MDAGRCESHGVTRCISCSPRQTIRVQPAPALVAPVDFNPEDALDGPVAFATAPEPVSAPIEFDMQTQEAIERQKEILTARGGTAAPVVPAEVTSELSVSPEPSVQNEIFAASSVKSPIVEIARCIHKSQKDYEVAIDRVKRAEKELTEAQTAVAPAAELYAKHKETLRTLLQ